LATLAEELPGWIAAEQRQAAVAAEMKSREGFLREVQVLRSTPDLGQWLEERLALLSAGEATDKARVDDLRKESEGHEDATMRLREAERVVFLFAEAHGIDSRDLWRLLAGELECAEAVALILRRIAAALDREVAAPATVAVSSPPRDPSDLSADGKGTAPTDKLSLALATLCKHPDWSAARIAKEVGCSGPYLSKQPKWRAAVQAIKGVGQENLRKADRHRGHDMDEYQADAEDRSSASAGAGPKCASCGDPAGTDAAGKLLMHDGKPRCAECWTELHKDGS
jgi:hypothetical protein